MDVVDSAARACGMRKEFEPNELNDTGIAKVKSMRLAYSYLLDAIETLSPSAGRARSLAATKLEESSHWAVRAIAQDPVNAANVPNTPHPAPALNAAVESVARDFYATYMASCDGLNYQGKPCPLWPDLTDAVRRHWYTVAVRALNSTAALRGEEPMHIPAERELAHLPDPAAAIETWRRYVQ